MSAITTTKPLPVPPTTPPAPPSPAVDRSSPKLNGFYTCNSSSTFTNTTTTTTTTTSSNVNKPNPNNNNNNNNSNRALAASTDYSYNISLANQDSNANIYRSSNSTWKGASESTALNPLMNYEYREISFDEVKLDEVAIGRYRKSLKETSYFVIISKVLNHTHTSCILCYLLLVSGAFGVVHKGIWRGATVAVKKLLVVMDEELLAQEVRREATVIQ